MKLLKLVGILLDYPRDELWEHRDELRVSLADPAVPEKFRTELEAFLESLLGGDMLERQSEWIETFDRGRSMSLLLFEHIHGESRDRGQAMVDLNRAYEEKGFKLAAAELPDYLPLVLEFLSHQDKAMVQDWLVNISHLLALLATRAKARNSRYQPLFNLLVELSGSGQDWNWLKERVADEPRDDTPEAMDEVWMEEEVRFGPDKHLITSSTNPAGPAQKKRIATQQETN